MTARAAQCKCGVHGFAMNPYVSLRLATAPYYREARVTFAWRRTACRMRHCFARRIVKTGGRRELLRTSTRWAERQRIIEAEANRLAVLTRLCRAMGSAIGKHCSSSSCSLAMAKPFSWGIKRGPFSFVKENGPLFYCRAVRGIFLRAKFCARAYDCATKRVRRGSSEKRKQNGGTRWRKRSWGARM